MSNNVKNIWKSAVTSILLAFNLSACSPNNVNDNNDLTGAPGSGLEDCTVLTNKKGEQVILTCPIISPSSKLEVD